MPYVRTRRYGRRSNKRPRTVYGRRPRTVRRARSYARRSGPARPIRNQWKNPLARTAKYKFTYNDDYFTGILAVGGGYQDMHYFRGNSLYDPDETGVGCQPYGYDQVAGIYQNYEVYGSKITVYFTPDQEALKDVKCFVFAYPDTSVTYHEPSDVRRIPGCKAVTWSAGGGANKHNVVSNYCTSRRIYPLLAVDSSEYWSGTGASPASVWRWCVMFDSGTGAQEGTVTYDVKIVYYTKMQTYENINES